MTKKERQSVTVDPEVKTYLQRDDVNASGLINKLVKMKMGEEAINEEILKMRIEMEKTAYKQDAQSARNHLEQYNRLKERLKEHQENTTNVLDEAEEHLSYHQLYEDSNPVEFWAEKADMTKDEFLTEMRGRIND